MNKDFTSPDWKQQLPRPVWENHADYLEFYERTWEIAHAHVRSIPGMPQDPYMDEAYCDTQVWIWDTCFMTLFCKFAQGAFPGYETFRNFYEVLYDGKSLPKIVPKADEPEWTHAIPGVENEIMIHIADNPPLFAWGEYENALFHGDEEHLKTLLYEKQYLQKHYHWLEQLKEKIHLPHVLCQTHWIAEDLGYRWEGGCSGMDNTPRGRKTVPAVEARPNDPDLLWVDALCQQALSAKKIADLFRLVEDEENAKIWDAAFAQKKELVNTYYWDAEDKFYYDIDVNTHAFCKVPTVASYWTLTAGIALKDRADALASLLSDPNFFGGTVPLLSLPPKDGDYFADGRYWRGGLWLPTAYAALKGLSDYGYRTEVREAAQKILAHMLLTYQTYAPHTVWECYAPEAPAPAHTAYNKDLARPDFCGWSALGPIAIFLEYVLGFYSVNAFTKTVSWALPSTAEEIGIRNLRFGDILTDITAKNGVCHVTSNAPYTLKINETAYAIRAGAQTFSV